MDMVITRHAPPGVKRYAWHADVPTFTEPTATALAAVLQAETWLHAVSGRRHLERILQVGRATVVCAWRRNDIELRRRVSRLDVVHHRRGKAFGLR